METGNEKSILIISINAIGDAYLSFSAIKSIQEIYPGAKFYFLLNEKASLLFPLLQAENIFALQSRTISDALRMIFNLRRFSFDFAFTFFPGRLNSIFLYLAKAEIKAGYLNFKKVENWFNRSQKVFTNLKLKINTEWKPEFNFLERIKLVLKVTGFNTEKVQKNLLQNMKLSAGKNEHILIHPFSLISNKSLSIIQLIAMIDYFRKKLGNQLIVIGGKELSAVPELFRRLKDAEVIIRLNESLTDLVALINNSKIFAAVDSFPIHIADSLNTNFVGIFGPTRPTSVIIHSEKSIFFNLRNLQDVDENRLIQEFDKYLNNSGFNET